MKTLQKIKSAALASIVPLYFVALGHHIYQDTRLLQQRHEALRAQNPVATRQIKVYTLYGFDDDADPGIDRIVQNGILTPGIRPGIPSLLYKEFKEGEDGFEGMLHQLTSKQSSKEY
jgi:hypothetical protein